MAKVRRQRINDDAGGRQQKNKSSGGAATRRSRSTSERSPVDKGHSRRPESASNVRKQQEQMIQIFQILAIKFCAT